MIVALTGTPGTGKTSVSKILKKKGYDIVDFNKIASDENFLISKDKKRDSNIVDIKKFDDYIKKRYTGEDTVIIEGHLSHLLKNIDKVIVLRCHPKKLRNNLINKAWKEGKIRENLEAEILDIILCEAVDVHSKKNVFEIDITDKAINEVSSSILEIIDNNFKNMKKYNIGQIDWSEEILKEF